MHTAELCCWLSQVVLGASIDEALQWAQQEGHLAPQATQLVKEAMQQKDQPFSSKCAWLTTGGASGQRTAAPASASYAIIDIPLTSVC